MDIFGKVNQQLREAHKKDVTIFKIEKFELDSDPKKCAMIGQDMLKNDENGVPKKVKVFFNDPSGKSMNIQDFADESSMSHTMPGGMVRLDKVQERADGSYVCSHMQRVQKKEGLRQDRNGNQHETGISRAWTKVLPMLDEDGNIAVLESGNGNQFSRGRAMVVPEDSKGLPLEFGEKFPEQLKAAAQAAIDNAPDQSKPFLLMRRENDHKVRELVIPNQRQDASGNYVPMTKQEQMDILGKLKVTQGFMALNDSGEANGHQMEAVPGFQLDVYGMLNDPKSGQRLERPRLQTMVEETARRFALPKKPGQKKPDMEMSDSPEYKLAVISYEIPKSDNSKSASLQTLGVVPNKTASPNAGLTVTPNPYYEDPNVAAAEKASQEAAQRNAQGTQNNEQPAAQNTTQQTESQPQQATQQPEQPAPEDVDTTDPELYDEMEDLDIDELSQELAAQGL